MPARKRAREHRHGLGDLDDAPTRSTANVEGPQHENTGYRARSRESLESAVQAWCQAHPTGLTIGHIGKGVHEKLVTINGFGRWLNLYLVSAPEGVRSTRPGYVIHRDALHDLIDALQTATAVLDAENRDLDRIAQELSE